MENIDIEIVEFNSLLQKKSIELRNKILREPLGMAFTAEELANEKNQIHIVASIRDIVIGVVILKILCDTTLKMRQVAVDFDLQNTGIGKKMIQFSEEYAKENNFNKIIENYPRENFNKTFIELIKAESKNNPNSRTAFLKNLGLPLMIHLNPYRN